MTLFDDVSARAKVQFPDLQIKFKNESTFMKILGAILFFNPAFMNQYFTTIGSTVYAPSQEYVNNSPEMATEVLLHELVHVYDAEHGNKFLYGFLYTIPQIFVLLLIPLLFIVGWKFSLLALLFLAPLPAYFRMKDERRGYTISAYILGKFAQLGHTINWDANQAFLIAQFKGPAYYFMWPFGNIDTYFADVIAQCKLGNRPTEVEAAVYDIIDKVLLG